MSRNNQVKTSKADRPSSKMNCLMNRRPSLALLLLTAGILPLAAQVQPATLPHHVVSALPSATRLPHTQLIEQDRLSVTVVLKLSDEAGRDALALEQKDPNSPNYRKTIGLSEFTSRFGPTQQAYDSVLAYLQQSGLMLEKGSDSRMTLTVSGSRAQIERTFNVNIDDYQLAERTFHAISTDPSVPAALAPLIASVSGLSNMAQWRPAGGPSPGLGSSIATAYNGSLTPAGTTNTGGLPPGIDGTGQTVGLVEFSGFYTSDVENWLVWAGLPASMINHLSTVTINGGSSSCVPDGSGGCGGPTEVLLDIAAVMSMAPGADVVVYNASGDDYASVIESIGSAIITSYPGKGTLSMSWNECENEVSTSDAEGLESFLTNYAVMGLTLFAASGDNGSTCMPGGITVHPDTVSFPSETPHTVSVGGTNLSVYSGNAYLAENWWGYMNPVGAAGGGFGVSKVFAEPSYQVPFYAGATGRSVPDVAAESTPGIAVCQATTSKSPNCFDVAGTSLATPLWAAIWALGGQVSAHEGWSTQSASNGVLYSIPGTFHTPASMTGPDNDFQHLGLGSPDITAVIAMTNPPRVDSYSPTSGSAAGGTTVTITGAGFVGIEKVTFDGVAATDVTIISDTKLTAVSPVAPDAMVFINVVTRGGTAVAPVPFVYLPKIDSVTPNIGPLQGLTAVTVTGTFAKDYTFTFGGAAATSVSCSNTKCTMVTPAHASGPVNVVAETPTGAGNYTLDNGYTYQGLSITRFSPAIGPTTGNITVEIFGTSLTDATTVSFGGTVVGGLSCSSDGTGCYLFAPAHAVGSVYLTATANGLTSAPTSTPFTFATYPTVSSISPASGMAGTVVTLTGTGFSTKPDATVFSFFETGMTGSCSSSTTCTATVPNVLGVGTAEASVNVTVGGLTSPEGVGFLYYGKVTPPQCKGTTCMVVAPTAPVH